MRITPIIFPFIFIIGSITNSFAQNKLSNKEFALKVYNLTTRDKNSYSQIYSANPKIIHSNVNETKFKILHPSFALQWKNKKQNLHEIELSFFDINKNDRKNFVREDSLGIPYHIDGGSVINTNISLRYEYILNLLKNKTIRIKPSIGFAASPYYRRENFKPFISNLFPHKTTEFGIRMFVAPRLQYDISKRIFCDVNIPICITDSYFSYQKQENPTLDHRYQCQSLFNFNAFPNYLSARIGAGIRL